MLVLVMLALLAVSVPAVAQDQAVPRFEESACPFTVPPGTDPECGYLTVPENRANPESRSIEIAVAVFRSANPDKPADPLIFLEGGPGGAALDLLPLVFMDRFQPLLETRDLILFDQRGVGQSQPALACTEIRDLTFDTLDQALTTDEYVSLYSEALTECAARLSGEGIDLTAYNSAENAADVADLIAALGYEQANLFGVSYGTKLALTVLRDHPERIRSVIIDSVYPPQVALTNVPVTFQRALDVLFAGCQQNPDCAAAYPDLETVFYDLVEQLNADPIRTDVLDPTTGRSLEAVVDGDTFASYVFNALYAAEIIPALPKSIYETRDGDYQFVSLMTTLVLQQLSYVFLGMNTAVQCAEEFTFETASSLEAVVAEARPELQGFARRGLVDPALLPLCAAWGAGQPDAIDNEPISSAVPALVVSGEYDPITPPSYGELAAETLSNSTVLSFPGVGHGAVFSSDCAMDIAEQFLADPAAKLDTGCIAGMNAPAFEIAGTAPAPVELEPFTSANGSYSAVKPVGWTEVLAGTFARGGLDQTALTFQIIPGASVEMAIPLISTQFGIDADTAVTRETDALTWTLLQGEFQGFAVLVALADDGRQAYLIVMVADPAERDAISESIFVPVIDSFRPGG
jgi:pimeloyl-ACP methyl ester carboxylesterase